MNEYNLRKIRTAYEEYTSVFGKQTTQFWLGWLAGTKYMNQKEIDNYLDGIYTEIDNEIYMKENKALKEG